MSQSTDPAWQGAIHVAESRLRTIDKALAALETAMPGATDSTQKSQSSDSSPPAAPPPRQNTSNRMSAELEIAQTIPSPLPPSSLQALDAFLAGAL